MKRARVKHYYLKVTPSKKLVVTFRRFKQKKTARAKSVKQLIIPLYFSSYKELVIKFQKKKKTPRPNAAVQLFIYWREMISVPTIIMLMGLSGVLYFGLQLTQDKRIEPPKTFAQTTPVPATFQENANKGLTRSEPTQVSVPSVEINYPVKPVGKLADGTMEVPPLFEPVTGWYKFSPTPGETGPSIIVGHVDTYKGPSVFYRLKDLQPGALINVTRADGKVVTFKVDALKQFEQANFPTAEVYGNLDYSGLRLITCGGTFNTATGHYTENTVVFASMVI